MNISRAKDRLGLDRMLSEHFLLPYSKANKIHKGTNAYISKSMAAEFPGLERSRIALEITPSDPSPHVRLGEINRNASSAKQGFINPND